MSIFASKSAFVELGLEAVAPSTAHMYQDCYICKDPLDVNIHVNATDKHHPAVRIGVCGHMHGQECLATWLDAGNSCPTCKRLLFEASGRGVSQSDINNVVHVLGRLVGKKRVMAAITRLVGKQELERAQLRRTHEDEEKKGEVREAQAHQNGLVSDDDWMESSDEDNLGVDEDEDFDMGDGKKEDGGVALDDDDVQPRSATA